MDRMDFLKKGFIGTEMFVTSLLFGNEFINENDELKPLDIIGFNHFLNAKTIKMANIVIHKVNTRGKADHDRINSIRSFFPSPDDAGVWIHQDA